MESSTITDSSIFVKKISNYFSKLLHSSQSVFSSSYHILVGSTISQLHVVDLIGDVAGQKMLKSLHSIHENKPPSFDGFNVNFFTIS